MSEISAGIANRVMDILVYVEHSVCTGTGKNQTVTSPMFYGASGIYISLLIHVLWLYTIEYYVVMEISVLMEYLILMMGLWFVVWLITDWLPHI